MSTKFKYTRSDTFKNTIRGLITKRAHIFNDLRLSDDPDVLKKDIAAIDHVLKLFGYDGELDTIMPRRKKNVEFNRGELTSLVLSEIRNSSSKFRTRDIAYNIMVKMNGNITRSKSISDMGRKISRILKGLYTEGLLEMNFDESHNVWWKRR